MKEKDMLEISDEMIGATDGKTCCTAFADPYIARMKRPSISWVSSLPLALIEIPVVGHAVKGMYNG